MIPGEYFINNNRIVCNAGRKTVRVNVSNTGDRPVQVGSHFHFFEINKQLEFDREKAFGLRLDIASGTAVRFEPGEEKEVVLVEMGGEKTVNGLNGLTCGNVEDTAVREKSIKKAGELNFKGAE